MNLRNEHLQLIDRYLSGLATASEVAQLEALMLADAQLRSDFLALARVDAALPGMIGNRGGLIAIPEATSPTARWRRWLPLAAAAALVICAGGIWWQVNRADRREIVARFGELTDCRWVDSSTTVQSGDPIARGKRIELSAGSVEVLFNTGARLKLVGPVIVETRTENGVFLTMGEAHLVAETPKSKGFVIETPNSKFVDISTAFSATVSPDGLSRLEVSEGGVDVVLGGVSEAQRLNSGESLFVEPGEQKIMTRIEPGDGTAAFRFPTIEPPSSSDLADQSSGHASIRAARGSLGGDSSHSGPASVLIDGAGQSRQDSPRESAYFDSTAGGSVLLDLGQLIAIRRINSYSWHQHNVIKEHRERARQRFTLYGYAGEQVPDFSLAPEESGWTRIARVNSDQFFRVNEGLDRPAQQACSVSAAKGEIGRFRYLLWEVRPNTFYGEFDVYGSPVPHQNP